VVHLFDPRGIVYDIDVSRIERDGQFKPIAADGRPLPVQIGWYGGGVHEGTRADGTHGRYEVLAGYIGRWIELP
jgi:hypothetical protein